MAEFPRLVFRGLLLLLGIAGLFVAPGATAQAPTPLHVMTFNIRYDNPNDAPHDWPNRKNRVASIVRFNEADLLGVQEALHHQLVDLDGLLPGYRRLGVGRDDGKQAGEFSAIYYRAARFTPLDHGTFWLSPTPDTPGSLGWDAAITRVCTWARYRDEQSGQVFYHFNTHFDHRGAEARTESARLILQKIQEIAGNTPVVLTGDFNFTPDAPGYGVLTASLVDTRTASQTPPHGPATTFYGFTYTEPSDRRIDYLFTSPNAITLRHGTLSDSWDGAFASDHLPVFAEIVLRP